MFVTGISNGGMMTLRLACDAADVFAGFVAVAASLGEDTAARVPTGAARPVALIDGTDDPLVPFARRRRPRARRRAAAASSAPRRRSRRSAASRAAAAVEAEPPLDRIADDGTALVVRRAVGCRRGVRVVLYEVQGGGHAWPGGLPLPREWLIGKVSRELDATDETWRFLGLGGNRRGPV